MPLFQIDVQKAVPGEYWTNVYHTEAADLAAAVAVANIVIDAERTIHQTNVQFDKYKVSAFPESGGVFVSGALTGPGEAPSVSNVPLFVVARVEFTCEMGRPGIKMYKGCLTEDDITGTGTIIEATRTFYGTWVDDLVTAAPGLCKPNGQNFIGGNLRAQVGMRQLRRGSKKRDTPVI